MTTSTGHRGFDAAYYRPQARLARSSDRAALKHYLATGWELGYSPHPAVDHLEVATDREASARARAAVEARTADWTEEPGSERPSAFYDEAAIRAERLDAAGLFDLEFYAASLPGVFLSREAALWHYMITPADEAPSPHPLFESDWFIRKARLKGHQPRGLENLVRVKHKLHSPGPHFDPVVWVEAHPEAMTHPAGPLVHYLSTADADTLTVPVEGVEPTTLGSLRDRLIARARGEQSHVDFLDDIESPAWSVDWDAIAGRSRVDDRVSIVIPTYEDWAMTARAIRSIIAFTPDHDIEIIVVDNGSHRVVSSLLTAMFHDEDRVVLYRVPTNANFANGSNIGFALSTGATTLFLNNDTEATAGWLEPLLARLRQPGVLGVQPLLLYPSGAIQAAGTAFSGLHTLPYHVLAGFPRQDAVASEGVEFRAITAACIAMRADDVQTLRGFDPVYVNGMEDVDLCLRAARDLGGSFRVATSSVVYHYESQSPGRFTGSWANRKIFLDRWAEEIRGADEEPYVRAGFEMSGHENISPEKGGLIRPIRPIVRRPARLVDSGPAAGLPSLRWAIKIASTGTTRGDLWGDTFFADDLAAALRVLGQEVVIDRSGAHARPGSDHIDDVVLNLRGQMPVAPQPGATNLLWIISHPEDVTDEELLAPYDVVYAASAPWAKATTMRIGREVKPLLQATNSDRFHPDVANGAEKHGIVFVGRTRRIFRPIVRDALAVGADVEIYGDGWEEFIDPSYVRAEHLDNSELPAMYAGARIVLNDHWDDMAALGFLSNRLFDAAATGALILSDHVGGLVETFGGLARTYKRADQLRKILVEGDDAWPDPEERRRLAQVIADEHSFRTRAVQLLSAVLDAREVPHRLKALLVRH
ncbi:glycosyltransferase [Labedella endophytica]|uniref:Glycosyltransferase n=1 Tax=Labedella endophytica TaxID=1523160 RepID=A0A433JNN1_9MICO|nr:glycosyltransferase [Labedella endophytica]RUQ98023.1 glycosyltransferase [Labedella endophytica]